MIQETEATKRPNVLFIFSDDHRFDLLGSVNPKIRTPHLNRLAARGVRFDQAMVTTSVCSPSRAAVLTGRYGSRNGVTGLNAAIHDTEKTFAHYLKEKGYRTAQFGKWHLHNNPADLGFDQYAAIHINGSWFEREIDTNVPTMPKELGGVFFERFMSDRIVEYISEHVSDDAKAENPFAIWWCNQVPHLDTDNNQTYPDVKRDPENKTENVPWGSEGGYRATYDVEEMPVARNWDDDLQTKPPHLRDSRYVTYSAEMGYGGEGGYTNMDTGERNSYKAQENIQQHNLEYYAAVTALDEEIGRVLDALEDPNGDGDKSDSILDNTWIVFTGDNGWQTGSHKFTSKLLSYEESIRVPLIVSGPGVRVRSDDSLVLNIDIMEMILDVAGVERPENLHSRNLRALVEDPDVDWRESILYEAITPDLGNEPHYTIRTDRYKYIETLGTTGGFEELYDLKTDPLELANLANDDQFADLKERLARELKEKRNKLSQ